MIDRIELEVAPRQTAYTYDAMGNVTSATMLAGTANAVATIFTYL